MADSLRELLARYLPTPYNTSQSSEAARPESSIFDQYIARLTTLPLSALSSTEPQSLSQSSHTNLLSLQALASRSHKSVTVSSDNLSTLHESLPAVAESAREIRKAIPKLDEKIVSFSTRFSKSKDDNALLDRRKKAMLLSRNVDRLSGVLELPTLLSATIASAGSGSTGAANYSQALDLFAHMKRLQILYPDSAIVRSALAEAEDAMRDMTLNLISSLRGQNIRLAAAIRTIGWLRRVSPELDQYSYGGTQPPGNMTTGGAGGAGGEGLFGSLFLTARLANLLNMLEALAPLQDLADQETARRESKRGTDTVAAGRGSSTNAGYVNPGQQTERYLKRYIEIFREQSFAAVSMFRNVFPANESSETPLDSILPLPSALASFPLHLVEMLVSTLKAYLPNVTDSTARESLLMQVLYAAGSLGRLGADFTMMIALLDEEELDGNHDVIGNGQAVNEESHAEEKEGVEEEGESRAAEWVNAIEKHRIQAARLDALTAGQDQLGTRRGSNEVTVT